MMGIFQAPVEGEPDLWHLRVAFYPLHRAKGRLKYLAGSESGAGAFLQDATPEAMARALREVRQ
jgi:UDPglucose--hexose-1-phosphate uridylyltransferase